MCNFILSQNGSICDFNSCKHDIFLHYVFHKGRNEKQIVPRGRGNDVVWCISTLPIFQTSMPSNSSFRVRRSWLSISGLVVFSLCISLFISLYIYEALFLYIYFFGYDFVIFLEIPFLLLLLICSAKFGVYPNVIYAWSM